MKNLFKAIGIFCLLGIAFSILQIVLAIAAPQWSSSLTGLYTMQSLSLIIVFGLSAYWGIHATEHTNPLQAAGFKNPLSSRNALLVFALAFAAIPFVAYSEELNKRLPLPDTFMMMEKMAQAITDRMMNVSSYGRLLLNIIIIAGVPAICEEFMFRGWIQRRLTAAMNHHIAIWVAAIIFSAIHMQFLGFVPRLFLGLILGYGYYYTGSLWASALMHFLNNAIATVAAFLMACKNPLAEHVNNIFEQGDTITSPTAISFAAASLAISITLLYFLSKYRKPEL